MPLATETGEWLYFAPADVKRVQFMPELTGEGESSDKYYGNGMSP